MNVDFFLEQYHKAFNINPHKIVLELGAQETNEIKRAQQARKRVRKIFNKLVKQENLWLVFITWDTKTALLKELKKCGFAIKDANDLIEGKKEDLIVNYDLLNPKGVYYLSHEIVDYSIIEKMILGIINNELGLEPYTEIKIYFISFFNEPIFLNIYDDRGIEILVTNENHLQRINNEFNDISLLS